MKINIFYLIAYTVILIFCILYLFYLLRILYIISCLPLINDVVGPLRDHTLGDHQPVMVLPIFIYNVINFPMCHNVYIIILCLAAFFLFIILVCWMIGLILRNIIFTNPFANIWPWNELDKEGFFVWFFEKTFLDKNKDIIKFVLNIFRAVLTPEEFAAAEQRCLENFVGKGSSNVRAPPANIEYIDYNFDTKYKEEEREKDIFYRESYLSIKQRSDANSYRNMTIARPDIVATMPDIPDVANQIHTEMNYVNIKLG
uniref:Uncharacterized protein n=1 Tax=viral metagenome TaxID=1070528 RepID=A0A6C0L9L0_9ZZZZ